MAYKIQHPPVPVAPLAHKRAASPQTPVDNPHPTKKPIWSRKPPKRISKRAEVARPVKQSTREPIREPTEQTLEACVEKLEEHPKAPIETSEWRVRHAHKSKLSPEEYSLRKKIIEEEKNEEEYWAKHPEEVQAKMRETDPDYGVYSPLPYPFDVELIYCDADPEDCEEEDEEEDDE
ncbi:hypothetical protein ASPCADRAFT_6447 [Aspergillus carbonarius ITEM 5010]|uniref:Uncharacterized protein n=1 Tax=Aspergillus carbonarius (strain ITEM 5010) TaxID=602072 RepID=A0A1R3RJW5_ASPC5|nr:hypothetical protein ASPCADRAFT_6447 [Aspergillus carbonarius ITEM 5010]